MEVGIFLISLTTLTPATKWYTINYNAKWRKIMAIALTLQYDKLTKEDYETAGKALNFPADWPEGLLYHDSAVVDGKLRVYEAWETRQDFDTYATEKLGPIIPGVLGDHAEAPTITETPLNTAYLKKIDVGTFN